MHTWVISYNGNEEVISIKKGRVTSGGKKRPEFGTEAQRSSSGHCTAVLLDLNGGHRAFPRLH